MGLAKVDVRLDLRAGRGNLKLPGMMGAAAAAVGGEGRVEFPVRTGAECCPTDCNIEKIGLERSADAAVGTWGADRDSWVCLATEDTEVERGLLVFSVGKGA